MWLLLYYEVWKVIGNMIEQEWKYCLVGNIKEKHEYGEDKEILIGTKQFSPGTKVYVAPINWGDGYEKVIVIGCPRHRKNYIEIVMRRKYIENLRLTKVYKPLILKMMKESKYSWWDNTEKSKEEIERIVNSYNMNQES